MKYRGKAFYAVTAPGFSCVYTDWGMVERARVFYPYLKWKKVYSQEQADKFIARNKSDAKIKMIYNYGETFDICVTVSYTIHPDSVEYIIDTRKTGMFRLHNPDYIIEYRSTEIRAILPGITLHEDVISSHMSAVYNVLQLLGEYVDVNIVLPNYSIYYALAYYSGTAQRSVCLVQDYIKSRLAKVGYTLKRMEDDNE